MTRSLALAAVALLVVTAVVLNVALASHGAAAPSIPLDDLADAFV